MEEVTQQTTTTQVTQAPPQKQSAYQKKKVIFKTYQIIWYLLGVVEVLLAFRVILKALGANPTGFVSMVYNLSDPLALPFTGIFKPSATSSNVIEWTTFLAMIVYLVIAYGVVKLIQLAKPNSPEEVEQGVNNP